MTRRNSIRGRFSRVTFSPDAKNLFASNKGDKSLLELNDYFNAFVQIIRNDLTRANLLLW
jgi:hypothetical protein